MTGRNFWYAVLAAVTLAFGTSLVADVDLNTLLADSGAKLWEMKPDAFMKLGQGKKYFDWNDGTKSCLAYRASVGPLLLSGLKVNEMRIFFQQDKAVKIEGNLYNRADDGELDRKSFETALERIFADFHHFTDDDGSAKTTKMIGGNRIHTRCWQGDRFHLTLRWSYAGSNKSSFRSEFITFQIAPKGDAAGGGMKLAQNINEELRKRVKAADNGDCFLDVPMVDQGDKSYCVVAATERVLKYYGSEVDQHMLAQLANSSSVGGTNMDEMMRVMRKAGAKLRFRFKELYTYKDMMSLSGIKRMIGDYNRSANKAKKSRISTDPARWEYNFARMLKSMDPEVFKDMRSRDRDFKRFQSDVKENIAKGLPVLWGVMLGLVPEAGLPQVMGGHMRLIIGFNDRTGEIIYSDSWGKNHAFKKMSWKDAWSMTLMTVVCFPRSSRG